MLKARILLIFLGVMCSLAAFFVATAADEKTNTIPRTSISELLNNKAKWNSMRIEIVGFYRSMAEVSAVYENETEAERPSLNAKKGLWIDYRNSPKVTLIEKGRVRFIGTFHYYPSRGCGHLNQWPAEIGELELFATELESSTNKAPGSSSTQSNSLHKNAPPIGK